MEFPSFLVTLLVVLNLFSLSTTTFAVVDTIRPSDILRDNNNTAILVSKQGTFGLGFFSPTTSSSKTRYLGIWYNKITGNQTVVWVANRCEPIKDSSSSLTTNNKGNLVLFSGQSNNRVLVWSTNSSKQAREPLVQLLDDGNLVLRDDKDSNTTKYLWESFDYPTNTMLPGMILGWDLKREEQQVWESYYKIPGDKCDIYGTCGANSKCTIMDDKPICQCLQGFEPKNQNNLSQGCMRNSFVSCNDKEKDVFYLTTELKVPETKYTWASKSMKLDECNAKCLSNCSCSAYGYNSNLDGSISDLAIGTECVLWFGDLFDTRNPKAPKETLVGSNGNSKVKKAVIIIAVILFVGLVLIGYYIYRRRCIDVAVADVIVIDNHRCEKRVLHLYSGHFVLILTIA
ncbi:hypothetical protein G4B88_000073 [Cannabis sativa]|uniref:Uncharacterized protein n=1 Tax=Cannabis sativa TaxID=3483 RepID=A0A7J6G089_CANSA|nr:hypothetical protein G4B88_000073 [Cannabis sativa]